jgi:hypothetical protein
MAITYAVSKVATTFTVNYRATGPTLGLFTYNQKRGFLSFDLPGAGIDPSSVESATLILNCTTVVGGGCPVQLRSAVDPTGWGTTLDATHDDWASTKDVVEGTTVVTATGTQTWSVAPTSLSGTGRTFFSLFNEDEGLGAPYQTGVTFNSSTAGTVANRPILRLVLRTGQVISIQMGHI